MLTATALRERGWTAAAIISWLGEPDRTVTSRYGRSAPRTRLFLESRVRGIEARDDFKAWLAQRQDRGARATAAAKRKADGLVDKLKAWTPQLAVLPLAMVRRAAIDAYNVRLARRDDEEHGPATETSDERFLARITVNYLRHELTAYDRTLEAVRGQIGVRAAEQQIRARVYGVIAAKYPDLAEECRRQMTARGVTSG